MIFRNNHYFNSNLEGLSLLTKLHGRCSKQFHQNAALYKEKFRNDFNPFEITLHGHTFDKGPYHDNWVGYLGSQNLADHGP